MNKLDKIRIVFSDDSIQVKEYKENEKEKKIYYFRVTSDTIDRVGDVVIPEGVDVSNYKNNPVFLFAHDSHSFPIGKAVDFDNFPIVGFVFADTEEGKKAEYLVSNGYIKTVSIGFRIKECYDKDGVYFGKTFADLEKDFPEIYKKFESDIAKGKIWRVITKSELFEVSLVPVPANPQATLVMASKGISICTGYDCKTDSFIFLNKELFDVVEKNAVSYSVHPKDMKKDEESSWDKEKAIESLRKWASKDGSGEKDTIDWIKYRKGFTWYDANAIDNFTSYKYPHHWVKDGDFYVVKRGVITAMAFFMKYYKNLPTDDRQGVYDHLAKHYTNDFDMIPPEWNPKKESDYTIIDIINQHIEKGVDIETVIEFIKLHNSEEIANQLKSYIKGELEMIEKLLNQIKEMESKINELEKVIKQKEEELKRNIENIDKTEDKDIINSDNNESKADSPSQNGEVEEKNESADDVVKVKIDTEQVKEILQTLIKQKIYGGK